MTGKAKSESADQAAAIQQEIARRASKSGCVAGNCAAKTGDVVFWCDACLLRAAGSPHGADLWLMINAAERAAWSRKWSALKAVRKDLEAVIGKRPHFEAWAPAPKEDA